MAPRPLPTSQIVLPDAISFHENPKEKQGAWGSVRPNKKFIIIPLARDTPSPLILDRAIIPDVNSWERKNM
jgi:hypothetical protein